LVTCFGKASTFARLLSFFSALTLNHSDVSYMLTKREKALNSWSVSTQIGGGIATLFVLKSTPVGTQVWECFPYLFRTLETKMPAC
jgi:hypothetical protein